jgi:enoyl-[acyl-carrier protein] reductase I
MGMFDGKKGVIMGIANEYSIAANVAQKLSAEGAELGFNHLPDKEGKDRMAKRLQRVTEPLNTKFGIPCDVTSDEDLDRFFARVKEEFGTIDFLVHSIAYAPIDDIKCRTADVSRAGFLEAMNISCYSLMAVAKRAEELMPNGGSIVTMTYFGGEKVVGGYNLMGVCKAALDSATRYLAYDMGPKQIRVNAISAGPIKTLAASAVGDFSQMLGLNAAYAPNGKNCTPDDVGNSSLFLLSDMSAATTGEILHVDCGYNIMGGPGYAVERLGISAKK